MPNDFKDHLSKITPVILENPINYGNLMPALKELKALFLKASEVDTTHQDYRKDIHHGTGKAIGPEWAALCVDDLIRTKRFVSGTHKAILSVLKTKKESPVTLLYVGTGPFATLVMPLTTLFTPDQLQLVLVEINPISVESLKNAIKNFGVEAYVKEIISHDAAQLLIDEAHDIDILLLECLQFALVKEQQVAITYNLIPQLKKEVILVPQEIKLSFCAIDSKKKMAYMISNTSNEEKNYFKNINPVFILNKEEIIATTAAKTTEQLVFPNITSLFSEEDKANYDCIAIATEICVFDDEKLQVDECSLTMMYKLATTEKMSSYRGISSQYIVSEVPGLEISYLEN